MTAVVYRPAEDADRNFIVDAWVGSFRDSNSSGFIQVEDWYPVMIRQIEKALARPDVRAVVACVGSGRVADLLGFIVADTEERPPLVYYAYVKEHYRRGGRGRLWAGSGIGRGLFGAIDVDPAMPFNYVCWTPVCRLLERKIPMGMYRPKLGRFPKSERRSRT